MHFFGKFNSSSRNNFSIIFNIFSLTLLSIVEFIDDVIIFCIKIESYHQLKKSYNKIKVVTDEFDKVVKFLKTKHFPKNDLDMDNHLLLTPLLTYYDYKKACQKY